MFTCALTLKSVLMVLLGGGYLKNELPLTVAAVTNESYAEKDIPVPREAETKKLKAGGFPVKSVNPFSKAALRGMNRVKQYIGKFCVRKLSHKIRRVAIQKNRYKPDSNHTHTYFDGCLTTTCQLSHLSVAVI